MSNARQFCFLVCWILFVTRGFSQITDSSPLFATQTPLELRFDISFKSLKQETNDSTYMDGLFYYRANESTQWDTLEVKYRRRGKSRLDKCFFTPMRVKIKKKNSKGTVFEGNEDLKLVLPCERVRVNNDLVIKEFMCYKIYEQIAAYAFNTRLVNLKITEQTKGKDRSFEVLGFFLEDHDAVADRHGGQILKEKQLYPLRLQDTTAFQHALFQYLIANLDWHTYEQHNSKLMQLDRDKSYHVLPYDFDRSGFVDAYYAGVHPDFETRNVRERLYRGFCRDDSPVMEWVRQQYLEKENAIVDVVNTYGSYLPDKEVEKLKAFLDECFEILKEDEKFRFFVLDKCRTK